MKKITILGARENDLYAALLAKNKEYKALLNEDSLVNIVIFVEQ